MQIAGYNREVVRDALRIGMQDLEGLLGEGDALDYDNFVLFDGTVNGTREAVIFVRPTSVSPSRVALGTLPRDLNWKAHGPLPFCAVWVLPPNECFNRFEVSTPYLIRLTSWDGGELIDARGEFVREFEGVSRDWDGPQEEWYKFLGNALLHIRSITFSTNQG